MKYLLISILIFFSLSSYSTEPFDVYLYSDKPEDSSEEIVNAKGHITNIINPKIEVYLPDSDISTGQMVLICPGGGYGFVSNVNEGVLAAKWLNSIGVGAAVLHYRLPNGNGSIPIADARQAMKIIRENCDHWIMNIHNVGVMGFSAGGHLAAILATTTKNKNAIPDFEVLFYPVISMQDEYTHKGSQKNLLGENPSQELKAKYSAELQVTNITPPTFIVHCRDDKTVNISNSILFIEALSKKGIQVDSVFYDTGGHGWGFYENNMPYKNGELLRIISCFIHHN